MCVCLHSMHSCMGVDIYESACKSDIHKQVHIKCICQLQEGKGSSDAVKISYNAIWAMLPGKLL